jgi:protein-disulfide isomerase
MISRRFLGLTAILAFMLTAAVAAQPEQPSSADIAKELAALKASVTAMQKDLQEIKTLILSRPAAGPPASVVLDLGSNETKGDPNAKLTLVEFSDYQCPFCGRHERDTNPQIQKEYVETGKVKYVFLDLPLESIHRLAFKAAEAANCAGEQGRYWEMHDRLFENQQALEPWAPHAEAVGLDVAKFQECLDSSRQAAEVRRDMAEAQKAGITGTPGFFLAYTDPKSSSVRTVASIKGAQPFAAFKAEIDRLLAGPSKVGAP